MAEKRCKKAQITLFLIIGIFMLFAVGFLFFIASQTEIQPKEIGIEQSVSQLVAQCLKKRVIESYAVTGIDAERTRNYVDHELLSCADFSVFEDQADITHGDVRSSVRVSDEVISTQIELPIIIKQRDSVIRLNTFNYHLPRYFTTKLPVDKETGVLTETVIARSADDRLELYIEAGTRVLTNDEEPLEEITIHTRSVTQRDPILYYYTVYDLQPHGAYFQPKAKLRMKYVSSFNIENSLRIVKREIGSNFWKKMDSTPNIQRQMIETDIVGFSEVGLDPDCESTIFVSGDITLTKDEDGSCSGEYKIEIKEGSNAVLCGIYLVDSAINNRIIEQGFRLNSKYIYGSLYDQELTQSSLHDPEVLETINLAINNKVRPNQNQFFVHVDSEGGDCSARSAELTFMIKGTNLECTNVEGACCNDIEGCKVTDDPILPEEPPELEEPEPCGNKKGIVIHLRDTLTSEHWELYINEAKDLVGPDGWVLEDVVLGDGNAHGFAQAVKEAGMRPIIRISPPEGGVFNPTAFADYAYEIGEGLSPPGYFVQVCNEPNSGRDWECDMDANTYAQKMIEFEKRLHSEELDNDTRIKIVSAGLDPKQGSAGYAQQLFDYTGEEEEDGTIPVFHDAIDIWATHAYDEEQWQAEMEVVSKENIPVIVTEAGYPPRGESDFYDRLCPGEDVTKLLYNCLDPFADLNDVKDRAKEIEVGEECERNEWERCEHTCEEEYPECESEPDPITDETEWGCEYCDDYSENEKLYCCKTCTYWCPVITRWPVVEEWREAHQDFKDYMVGKFGDWSSDDIVIGVTPFLLFDGKEITGLVTEEGDIKFDYECEMEENFRPRYWEYVQYEYNARACEGVSYPHMEDPYRYTVFDEISTKTYANYNCPFLPSGPDKNDSGEAPPEEEGENFIEGHCLILYLESSCSGWKVIIKNICSRLFGDVNIYDLPHSDGPISCSKSNGNPCSVPVFNIGPEVIVTISGSHDLTGTQQLKSCLLCDQCTDGEEWPEHKRPPVGEFCVSVRLRCG